MHAALIILDGWGLGAGARDADESSAGSTDESSADSTDESLDGSTGESTAASHESEAGRDAVAFADTPTFDAAAARGAYGRMEVHGRRVGLPDAQMGNSEVGHLNIGAGRVVQQAYTRINDAIESDKLRENAAVQSALEYARENDGRVHLMGLLSNGGVHSDMKHLEALVDVCAAEGVPAVSHAFTDGRDTDPAIADEFLAEVAAHADAAGTGEIATVIGRYHAMDRDQNWERTKKAYDAIVGRRAEYEAETAVEAVRRAYDRDETDEFVEPTVVADRPALQDGDAVFFFNFRADRARQLVRMLTNTRPDWEYDLSPPAIRMATLTEYDETFDFPVAFPPNQPADTIGEVVADAGLTQLRIAESEKYPHVTYFLNGGREVEFPGESRRIVESPDVPTYDLQPEMSAPEVTDEALRIVEESDPDLLVLNYANPDMVGHTGDFDAAVEAVETVDEQLARLLDGVANAGGHVIVTADHGNADDMGTEESPHTAHTYNPVPLVYLMPDGDDGGWQIREGGSLCDVAPTLLEVVDVAQPAAMTGESLLE